MPTQTILIDARGSGDARLSGLERPAWVFADAAGAGRAEVWLGRAPLPAGSLVGGGSASLALALGHPLRVREANPANQADSAVAADGFARLGMRAKLAATAAGGAAIGGRARLRPPANLLGPLAGAVDLSARAFLAVGSGLSAAAA